MTKSLFPSEAGYVKGLTGITSLSTSLSSEISTRDSADISLSTILSTRGSDDISLSTGLSSEISVRGNDDISLSTALSTEIWTDYSNTLSLTYAISGEISIRDSADLSLSTAIDNVSGGTFDPTSLSSAISSEISTRTSGVLSLSTALGSVSATSSYSGLTYNIVTGATISTTGTTTINFTTTDFYSQVISGNTTTGITYDFTSGVTGKTLTMYITNTGGGNTTGCVFSATTCKTFGVYVPSRTNIISVICVSGTNPCYFVTIANS